jgi:hypothetical protein
MPTPSTIIPAAIGGCAVGTEGSEPSTGSMTRSSPVTRTDMSAPCSKADRPGARPHGWVRTKLAVGESTRPRLVVR